MGCGSSKPGAEATDVAPAQAPPPATSAPPVSSSVPPAFDTAVDNPLENLSSGPVASKPAVAAPSRPDSGAASGKEEEAAAAPARKVEASRPPEPPQPPPPSDQLHHAPEQIVAPQVQKAESNKEQAAMGVQTEVSGAGEIAQVSGAGEIAQTAPAVEETPKAAASKEADVKQQEEEQVAEVEEKTEEEAKVEEEAETGAEAEQEEEEVKETKEEEMARRRAYAEAAYAKARAIREEQERVQRKKDRQLQSESAGKLMADGDTQLAANKPDQALPPYEEALALFRKLHAGDKPAGEAPDSPRYKSALAQCIHKVGQCAVALAADCLDGEKNEMDACASWLLRAEEISAEPLSSGYTDLAEVARITEELASRWAQEECFEQAEPLLEKVLAFKRQLHAADPECEPVARSANDLAGCLANQKKLEKAEALFRESLRIYQAFHQRQGEPDHPEVAMAVANLAQLLTFRAIPKQDLTKYEEAEALYRRALDANLAHYGPADAEVAASMSSLAWLLENRGEPEKVQEAEALYSKALAITEQAHCLHDPEVLEALQNVVNVLKVIATDSAQPEVEYAKAEPLCRRILKHFEVLYPLEDDEELASAVTQLGFVIREQGNDYDELEQLCRRALRIYMRVYPHGDEPIMVNTLDNLAFVMGTKARYDESRAFTRRADAIRETCRAEQEEREAGQRAANIEKAKQDKLEAALAAIKI